MLYFAVRLIELALTLSMGFTRSTFEQGDTFSAIAVARSEAHRALHTTILYSDSLKLLSFATSPPSPCAGAVCDTPLDGTPILLVATFQAKQNTPTGLAKITVGAFDDAGNETFLTKYIFIGTVPQPRHYYRFAPIITR